MAFMPYETAPLNKCLHAINLPLFHASSPELRLIPDLNQALRQGKV